MARTYRAIVPLLTLAACRVNFDDRADGSTQIALACNVPVPVAAVPAGNGLTTTVSGDAVVAAWLDGATSVRAEAITFLDDTHVVAHGLDYSSLGSGVQTVSLANDGVAMLVATGTSSGSSVVALDSRFTPTATSHTTPTALNSSHGLIPTGRTSDPEFVLAGLDGQTTSELRGIARDTTILNVLNVGTNDFRIYMVQMDGRVATFNSISGNRCGLASADDQLLARGAAVGVGTDGQCTQAAGAHFPGRAQMLVVRHDTVDNDLNYTLDNISGTTFTAVPESRLRTPGNEARPQGVSDGYWVSYETAGTLEAVHLDLGGTVGTPVVLGPLANATAHDLALRHGEPYAVFFASSGLAIAKLCL